jgi:hypothetical protein
MRAGVRAADEGEAAGVAEAVLRRDRVVNDVAVGVDGALPGDGVGGIVVAEEA